MLKDRPHDFMVDFKAPGLLILMKVMRKTTLFDNRPTKTPNRKTASTLLPLNRVLSVLHRTSLMEEVSNNQTMKLGIIIILASAPPRNQFQPAPPARDMSTSSPGFRSFSSTHNEPPSHPAPAPSPPPMTPPVRQRSPIRVSACASPPIKKDGCLIFKDNMEERIAAISKEIDHLVNGILNYGNTDTLSIDEIKSFINSSELAGQITIKQLSALVTLFTPWKAVSSNLCN